MTAAGLVVVSPLLTAEDSLLASVVALAYPACDVVLIAVVIGSVGVLGWRPEPTLWLVGAGALLNAAADSGYALLQFSGGYVDGGLLDPLWPLATLLIALGVVPHRAPRPMVTVQGHRLLLVPGVAGLLSIGVLLPVGAGILAPARLLAAATLVAGFLRAGLLLREVEALPETRRQAMTDDLTGLANRRALLARLDALLARRGSPAPAAGAGVAVLVIDLDAFKPVNDNLGHAAGDVLLIGIAERLTGLLHEHDLVARMGGDEFAVVLKNASAERALEVAEGVVEAVGHPTRLLDIDVAVGCSVGVALAPLHADTRNELLRCADAAMYAAKHSGGGVVQYRPSTQPTSPEDLGLLHALRSAITGGELVLHYQHVVALPSREVVGFEALVRWEHPSRGLLAPGHFVPLAERGGLARALTDAVLELAAVRLAQMRRSGEERWIAVNVPAMLLRDAGLALRVGALLARHSLPPQSLVLEITETALVPEGDVAVNAVQALRDLGVAVSMDDYGTGYTSVALLRRLGLTELKLDRSLPVAAVDEKESSAMAVLSGSVALAQALGLTVVGEGVETKEQLRVLIELGVPLAQGFLLGRPAPAPAREGAQAALAGPAAPRLAGPAAPRQRDPDQATVSPGR